MKASLSRKFIFCYILIGITGFLLVTGGGSRLIEKHLEHSLSESFYQEAVSIASNETVTHNISSYNLDTIQESLTSIAIAQDTEIWILNNQNEIIVNTDKRQVMQEETTEMIIGNKTFDTQHEAYIMGILNVTPDSFSDGGKFNTLDAALRQTERMVEEGAAIIDIGGESTRQGYTKLSDEEELSRVLPVIEAVKKRFDVPVSLDTYKSGVAREGLRAGADMINDIWGLQYDPAMAKVIADADAACCLMHNRKNTDYHDFMKDVLMDLENSLELAKNAGISYDKIMVDPGVGFAKSYEQNLTVIKNVSELHSLGLPVLMAASRKSVVGLTLDLPKDERLEGTIAITVAAVLSGCSFIRVHDVKENLRAMRMAKAILQAE